MKFIVEKEKLEREVGGEGGLFMGFELMLDGPSDILKN